MRHNLSAPSYIVSQATGFHGWSSFETWIVGLRSIYNDVCVIQPRTSWNSLSLECDDGFCDFLKMKSASPIFLCGFDWHSQPIHQNPVCRDLLRAWPGHRIGLFQEHLSASWIRQDLTISNDFDIAALSAAECLTHIVCHHESDVSHLRKIGINIPIIFMPFCADVSLFRNKVVAEDRDKRAFFRGKIDDFIGLSPYSDRFSIMNHLKDKNGFVIETLTDRDYINREVMVNNYVSELNKYLIQLNLPSLSDSLTCRPFEVMSCGGLLLQNKPMGEISSKVIPESFYFEFERKKPDSILEAVEFINGNLKYAIDVAKNGWRHVTENHNSVVRTRQILNWVNGYQSEGDIVRDLIKCDVPSTGGKYIASTCIKSNSKIVNKKNSVHTKVCIVVDLVFYQYANSGIAKVWNRLLLDWKEKGYSQYFVLLIRDDALYSPPESVLKAYEKVVIPKYTGCNDDQLLQSFCDLKNATLFISTYYTRPKYTRSILLLHDCIPEFINPNFFDDLEWKNKREAINYASAFFCISKTTSEHLVEYYPDETEGKRIYVSPNSFPEDFVRSSNKTIDEFKAKYNIKLPYFLFVGERLGYLGYKNVERICVALGNLAKQYPDLPAKYSLLFIGGAELGDSYSVEPGLERHLSMWEIQRITLSDIELNVAYSGACLTIYPSIIEGFGLPPGESLFCETPVVAWKSSINDEIYKDTINYLNDELPQSIENQLYYYIINLSELKKNIKESVCKLKKIALTRGGSTQSSSLLEVLILNGQLLLDWTNPSIFPLMFDTNINDRSAWLNRLVDGHPDEITGGGLRFGEEVLRSAAIVSIFRADEFIVECINDLTNQTEYLDDQMEILIVDSASPSNEKILINSIIHSKCKIRYLRTLERESLYRAWNRGVRCSSSKYISNANVDDRHCADFFKRLSDQLDLNKSVQLFYPQQYISQIPNEDFFHHKPKRTWAWPEFSLDQLRLGNHVGSQPMWRRSIHQKIGYFDERYRIAGDYDFWCRIAHNLGPLKLYPIHLGVYYFNGSGVEHGDPINSELEVKSICDYYGINKNYTVSPADIDRLIAKNTDSRNIDDLQYNGLILNSKVTVFIKYNHDIGSYTKLLDSILSQSINISYILNICVFINGYQKEIIGSIIKSYFPICQQQLNFIFDVSELNNYNSSDFFAVVREPLIDRFELERKLKKLSNYANQHTGALDGANESIVGCISNSHVGIMTSLEIGNLL